MTGAVIEIGQSWRSNDPRDKKRPAFTITALDNDYATCERRDSKTGRLIRRRIRLDRFRATSTGYVLVARHQEG